MNREHHRIHENGFLSLKTLGQKIYRRSFGTRTLTLSAEFFKISSKEFLLCACVQGLHCMLLVVALEVAFQKFNLAKEMGPKELKIALDSLFLPK